MEDNKADNSSDRDRKMKGKFESYDDAQESKDKKKRPKRALFLPSLEDDKEDDKKLGLFEAFVKPDEKEEVEEDQEEAELAEDSAEEEQSSLEKIDEEEAQWVESQIISAHQEEIGAELAEVEDDSAEEAEVLADGAFLENLQEKLDNGESLNEETIEEALVETANELDIDVPEEAEAAEPVAESEPVSEVIEDEEDEPTPAPVTRPAPVPLTPPAPPIIPRPNFASPIPIGPNLDIPSPDMSPTETAVERRRNRGADLLVGGIVGYLLGRRRGRIRTEERLIPIQEKLKKEVGELNDKVSRSEEKIRALTAQKIEQLDGSPAKVIERLEQRLERKRGVISQPEVSSIEEAAEKTRANTDILTVPQLLEVADGIRRDGVSVKQLYETGRLDANGLRRVVQEYLRTGNYEKALFEELKGDEYAREQSYEKASTSKVNSDGASMGMGGIYGTDSSLTPETHEPVRPLDSFPVLNQTVKYQDSNRQIPLLAVVAFGVLIAVALVVLLF